VRGGEYINGESSWSVLDISRMSPEFDRDDVPEILRVRSFFSECRAS